MGYPEKLYATIENINGEEVVRCGTSPYLKDQKEYVLVEHTYKEFLDTWKKLRDLSKRVYPDRYKWVCMQHGIQEALALKMYALFERICRGEMPYENSKPISDEKIAKIIQLGVEAKTLYENCCHSVDLTNFKYHKYGDELKNILVIWSAKDSEKRNEAEFSLTTSEVFVTIGEMVKNGAVVHNIIRQADVICDISECLNFSQEERRGNKRMNVYDGDVFVTYVSDTRYSSVFDYDNCGLFLCHNGAYRKLLYTPNKGYWRKGEPDIDDGMEIEIDGDGIFNSYVLRGCDRAWRRIGNVHVDCGFLIEKQVF